MAVFGGPKGSTIAERVALANAWLAVSRDFASSVTKALKTSCDLAHPGQRWTKHWIKHLPAYTLLGFCSTAIAGMLVMKVVHPTSLRLGLAINCELDPQNLMVFRQRLRL